MTRLLPGPLETLDPEVASLIAQEAQRQSDRLELVASENHISMAQREASGSMLADTTVEGYPGARFLAASANVDTLERLAVARACQLFGARFANVQPHSGTQANQAAMMALLQPGETLLSMDPLAGGHFSHGASGTLSGDWFTARHYGVDPHTGLIDPDEVLALARQHRPRLIIAGASAYPRSIDLSASQPSHVRSARDCWWTWRMWPGWLPVATSPIPCRMPMWSPPPLTRTCEALAAA